MSNDQRQYVTFYGIEYTDWNETFGSFVNHHKILTQEYISDACTCPTMSEPAHGEWKFLYPHHLKRTYFIEGRIEGEIAVSSTATATITSYRASICKVHGASNKEEELASTGWIVVNKELAYHPTLHVGDEAVFHYWIDCYEEKKVTDKERIYLKLEFNADPSIIFLHSNDSKWTDVWVEVPFKM
jgi:hypothetical protein